MYKESESIRRPTNTQKRRSRWRMDGGVYIYVLVLSVRRTVCTVARSRMGWPTSSLCCFYRNRHTNVNVNANGARTRGWVRLGWVGLRRSELSLCTEWTNSPAMKMPLDKLDAKMGMTAIEERLWGCIQRVDARIY